MTAEPKGFPKRFPVRPGEGQSVRYRVAHALARAYLRTFFGHRLRIEGMEDMPADGPLLVVSNHLSNVDPLIFGGMFPRTLFAMAKIEMYTLRPVAWWLGGCNCFPVDRSGPDRRAVTRALEVLRDRGRLLLFIEGTRSPTATMQRAEPGAGFIARRSGATIQPVAIWGTETAARVRVPLFNRARITVRYGPAFVPEAGVRGDDVRIADELGAAVAALLPVAYRGVYADAVRTPPPVSAGN